MLPLFPQYASSSTGSALEEIMRVASVPWNVPSIDIVPPFCPLMPHVAEPDHLRAAHAHQVAIFRAMTPQQRLRQALKMNQMMRTALAAGFVRDSRSGARRRSNARWRTVFSMHTPDEVALFALRLEVIGAPYMVTGATAAILWDNDA